METIFCPVLHKVLTKNEWIGLIMNVISFGVTRFSIFFNISFKIKEGFLIFVNFLVIQDENEDTISPMNIILERH